jgi:AraC-like DNA-binding protein
MTDIEMEYKTYSPIPLLAPLIKLFWSLEADATAIAEKQTIVPDGCMEMIIHYGDPYLQFLESGSTILQPRSFVFGQVTRMLEIAPTGRTGILAARFHPDGFAPFFIGRVQAMENRAVSLLELFGEAGDSLEREILSALTMEDRIAILENFLTNRLTSLHRIDAIVKSGVGALLDSKGQLSVTELAEQVEINRRKLERKFATVIGLSPKQLSKMIRFQVTLKALGKKSFPDLTTLALSHGYFDQAHFIKDFQEFTGLSPRKFYANSMTLSNFFISTE